MSEKKDTQNRVKVAKYSKFSFDAPSPLFEKIMGKSTVYANCSHYQHTT